MIYFISVIAYINFKNYFMNFMIDFFENGSYNVDVDIIKN